MTTKPMFKEGPDGEMFLSPAAVFLLAASALYGDPSETSAKGKQNAAKIIDGILSAAVARGFTQRDILETLLSRNDKDQRTLAIAQVACDAAGNELVISIIAGAMGSE